MVCGDEMANLFDIDPTALANNRCIPFCVCCNSADNCIVEDDENIITDDF